MINTQHSHLVLLDEAANVWGQLIISHQIDFLYSITCNQIMKGQQISPWTFLKEKLEDDQQNNDREQDDKKGFRLPSLSKRQDGKLKQHTQHFLRKKQRGSPNRQMLVVSLEQRKASFATIPIKKKTEPIEINNQPTLEKQKEETYQTRQIFEKRMILRLIYLQLQSEKFEQDKNFQSSPAQLPKTLAPSQQITPAQTQREKKLKNIPYNIKINPNRIHDKRSEHNFSLVRSIIKKIQKSSGTTSVNPFSKKHNIETLKIKLTQNMRNRG